MAILETAGGFLIEQAAEAFAGEFVKTAIKPLRKQFTNLALIEDAKIHIGIKDYFSSTYRNISHTRTLIHRDSVSVKNIYIPISFCRYDSDGRKIEVTDNQFNSEIQIYHKAMIQGLAGAGKSIFLKRYTLQRLEKKDKIPIFFELRHLDRNFRSLFENIYDYAKEQLPWLEVASFRHLLRTQKIELCLDALDEVKSSIRSVVRNQIAQLINEIPQINIIVTTRYGEYTNIHSNMMNYEVNPLSLSGAKELVMSLPMEHSYKVDFVKRLENGLYKNSSDLISNPLLCSIMLLTYESYAEIPHEYHIYYNHAYHVLFSKHDARKEAGYKREIQSKLDISQMSKVLEFISSRTYAFEQFEFTDIELLDYINEACSFNDINSNNSDIKDDLVESISMIQPDGLNLKFNHRSFQEYFCAKFITNAPDDTAFDCIEAVKDRYKIDSVIPMVKAMNILRLKNSWLTKCIKLDIENLEDQKSKNRSFDGVRSVFSKCRISINSLYFSIDNNSINFTIFNDLIDKKYKTEFRVDIQNFSDRNTGFDTVELYVRDAMSRYDRQPGSTIDWKNDQIILDLNKQNSLIISESKIWSAALEHIRNQLIRWHQEVESELYTKQNSPISAFRSAAAKRSGRVQGTLDGGIKNLANGDNDQESA